MVFLLLGALGLFLAVWIGRRPMMMRRGWRLLAAPAAMVLFAVAAWSAMRGGWGLSVVLSVVGLWLSAAVRRPSPRPQSRPPKEDGMSLGEARAMLGVPETATETDIDAAYRRLMRTAHPDAGGTEGLAAQLNAARDRLKRDLN
ncbi:J domain-containing protein [Phenylobacterium immobile]|uniref:J domain-containing protein n=1 Tax=Phenylobacterium immobile TaxID=21 RepID=UPI000A4554F7|nr:DnaJ domain-containing protein [Phenylobacterium immobile]